MEHSIDDHLLDFQKHIFLFNSDLVTFKLQKRLNTG